MMNQNELYLGIYSIDESSCLAPIETTVTLFTIKYCDSINSLDVNLILVEKPDEERAFEIDLTGFQYQVLDQKEIPRYASSCELPNVTVNKITCVAGLCASLRQIIKNKVSESPDHYSKELLGFKDACLLSCSETSVWTKFCEIDLIETLKTLGSEWSEKIPANLARFERHMSQPVRLHNLYKYAASKKFGDDTIDLVEDANDKSKRKIPEHIYAEGSHVTLADVIIFVCIHSYFSIRGLSAEHNLREVIPLTMKWYDKIKSSQTVSQTVGCLRFPQSERLNSSARYVLPHVDDQSLYKSDPKRYKPRNRIYTKQNDVDDSLELIRRLEVDLRLDPEPFGHRVTLNWDKIPSEATPRGGGLPEARLKRKTEQLENLCKPVLALAKAGDVVVDFCSGGGHLGILIAYMLPECEVALLENKEESLNRAKDRVKKLGLNNVRFYQCNLDYFKGDFDIGVSLHACGVATDLVIQHCLRKKAIFVCCPCCYGGVHDCHRVTYPRSDVFREKIDNRSYLVVGHSADQTHDKNNSKTEQGYKCMAVVDTDRKLHAEQFDYVVHLGKLVPDNCTPKNNLLVGIPKSKLT